AVAGYSLVAWSYRNLQRFRRLPASNFDLIEEF
ncbi:MAG: hypothetical protein ACI8P0_005240, partial [Planctomycetaceae bacterium]